MTGYEIVPEVLNRAACAHLISSAYDMDATEPRCVSMPHRKNPKFLLAMKLPHLIALARYRIGECDGLGSDYFFHPPGSVGMAEHTDNDYIEAAPDSLISLWIALCPVSRENGCLFVGYKDIVLGAGDAVLIAQDAPHGSRNNDSDSCRHALLLTYLAKGSSFRPGNTQQRNRVSLIH